MARLGRGVSTGSNSEERAALRAAFDGPEGPWPYDWVSEMKFREYDGHYVVVKGVTPEGHYVYADLARGSKGQTYQFQNDSLELTDEEWKGLWIPEECDSFELP